MSHFSVNAVRPMTAYILGVIALCAFGWAVAQNFIVLPYGVNSPYHKQIALTLFAVAAGCGVATILKNAQRNEKPWSVTRAQVNRFYALFLVTTFCAVLVAK
jgi:hypothetical protein